MILYHFLAVAQSAPLYTPPQLKVAAPVDADKYVRQLGSASEKVVFEKDLITFVFRGSEKAVQVPGWLGAQVSPVPGTDAYIAQARYPNAERVFLSYSVRSGDSYSHRVWRGRKSVLLPFEAKRLEGKILDRTIFSKNLQEDRKYTIYLPPQMQKRLPVVYLADRECEYFAHALEPLILAKKISPVALVGVSAGSYRGPSDKYDFMQDFRAREYLKPFDPERFPLHMKFFCDEIIPACEQEFGFSKRAQDRVICGYSNGGAFALTAVLERPDKFGSAIVLSPGATDFKDLAVISKGSRSRIWLAAGKLETFLGNARKACEVLKLSGVANHLDEYEAGHDILMWRAAFVKRLQSCLDGTRPR